MRTITCSWTLPRILKTRWKTIIGGFVFLFIFIQLARLLLSNESRRHRLTSNGSNQQYWGDKGPPPHVALSRALEYCNSPYLPVKGEEGSAPADFKLESVYILIRHGDRTPMGTFPSLPKYHYDCTLRPSNYPNHTNFVSFVTNLSDQQKLRRVDDMFRSFPVFPMVKKCENAQLTGHGVAQHLGIGTFLNKVYIQKHQLLKSNFKWHQIAIKCTRYTRTYQSALAFLYGFLPRFDLARMQIEPAAISFCSSKFTPGGCSCDMHNIIHRNIIHEIKKAGGDQTSKSYVQATKKLGIKAKPGNAPSIMDTLNLRYCHGKSLPCDGCNSEDVMTSIWDLIDRNGRYQSQSESYMKSQRLLMHPMLAEIATHMRRIIRSHDKDDLRFVLFSGHDITVTALSAALGIYKGFWPPYASRVVFELYSARKFGSLLHYIKILFNGKDVTKEVRFCKEQLVEGLCDVSQFLDFVQRGNLMELFGVDTYQKACALG